VRNWNGRSHRAMVMADWIRLGWQIL
jgi:hypothetical protein